MYLCVYFTATSLPFIDAARYVARRVLNTGKSLAVVPGGAQEALYSTPQVDTVSATETNLYACVFGGGGGSISDMFLLLLVCFLCFGL